METHDEHAMTSSVRADAPQIEVGVATHIGRRTTNADSYLSEEAAGLFAVADGLGDTPRSRLAAEKALAAVREMFGNRWRSYPPAARPIDEARERLMLGIERAHRELYAPWWAPEERMRSTFAGVVVCGEHLSIGHVGDSRVFVLHTSTGTISQQMEDHTVLGQALRDGESYDVAAALPDAHKLTQTLGVRCASDVQPIARRWEPGDIMLICTDGVSDRLDADTIAAVLLNIPDPGQAAQQLVDRASEAGGWDNATAVIVRRAT